MSQEEEEEEESNEEEGDEGETLTQELGDAPWCPLESNGAVRYFVRARVRADGYALVATDLARVWACRVHGAGAVTAQLAVHNPHLECTPARAAQLLAAALRRPDARTPLGAAAAGSTVFADAETPLPGAACPRPCAPSVLVLRLARRVAGYCFRWVFVCRPLGLGGARTDVDADAVAAAQRVQAEFLRAQLVAPALRVGAVALAALQAAAGPHAALDVPQRAADYVARLSPAVLAAQPCTGALAAALFRRCVPQLLSQQQPPSQSPSQPSEPPEPPEPEPDPQPLRPRAAKRARQGFV